MSTRAHFADWSDPHPHIVYLDVLTTSYYPDGLREVGAYHLAHERLRTRPRSPDAGKLAASVLAVDVQTLLLELARLGAAASVHPPVGRSQAQERPVRSSAH